MSLIIDSESQKRIAARIAARERGGPHYITLKDMVERLANAGFAPIAIGRSFGRSEAWALDKLREDYENR